MKIKIGQIWKFKGSEDKTGFVITEVATHPCDNVENLIIVYKPTSCFTSSSFYRKEQDFREILEFVSEPVVIKRKKNKLFSILNIHR